MIFRQILRLNDFYLEFWQSPVNFNYLQMKFISLLLFSDELSFGKFCY